MENMNLPLHGVKVVELATVVAAPTTARVLATYGADVIKVESLSGDVMRLAGTHEFTPYEDDCNPLFTIHNSNKKFISINIKSEEGKKILLDLLKDADVFITNVREKSLIKNGLDIVGGMTENHLMTLDLTKTGKTGKDMANVLELVGITANKNTVPNDPQSPFVTSGIRLGTAAVTTRGFDEDAMFEIADIIAQAIEHSDDKVVLP